MRKTIVKTWIAAKAKRMTTTALAIALLCPLVAEAGTFDHTHQELTDVLKEYVEKGLVDYSGLNQNPEGLDQYLRNLASVPLRKFQSWTKDQQLDFLINLYNAQTLRLILDNYPVDSIKDTGGLVTKPWDLKIADLFGKVVSLDTIEHGMIRKNYAESAIHFALVCAARGCPDLRAEAYQAGKLSEQLDDQAQSFLASRKKNLIDLDNQVLHLSPIFKWYKEDFQEGSRGVAYYISRYFQGDVARRLRTEKFKIRYTNYDWSLNIQRPARVRTNRKSSNE